MYNTKFKQGELWSLTTDYLEDDDTPIDISDHTGSLIIRQNDSGPKVAEATITKDGPNGRIVASLSSATTSSIPTGQYKYQLSLFIDGSRIDLLDGTIRVEPSLI